MTDTAASALAVWFRDASATSAYAGEFNNASVFDREGMLYLDAAGLAEACRGMTSALPVLSRQTGS
jgi:hypothetical protein